VDSLIAIDTHVHLEKDDLGKTSLPQPLIDAVSRYFRSEVERPHIDQIAEKYRDLKIAAVVFTVDATTSLGHPALSSSELATGAARNNDVLIPFGSVDPLQGVAAIDLARRLADESGVRGFKFHPTVQNFDPSSHDFWPLWETLQELGLPLVFHTGQTGIGAGLPGGYGLRLGLSNPILLDVVAAQFPELQIVMAHPSVPWQEEAIAVATHKANTWIDLSGWSPKYFPENLVRQANALLQDKVLFGSDFPLLSPERWMADFESLSLREEVRPKILKENAVRLLNLSRSSA
jgi:predicted TIM-barrel fold metal-dependent hydrolase